MNILRFPLTLSFAGVLVLSACGGGSSSSSDAVAVCKQACTQYVSLCLGDAGVDGTSAKTLCENSCTTTSTSSTKACSNSSAIISAYKACESKTTCEEYMACTDSVPGCTGGGTGGTSGGGTGGTSGTGTGGTSGTGTGGTSATGTGGTGGMAGTATATCADLTACCAKVTDATNKATCTSTVSSVQSLITAGSLTQAQGDASCAEVLALEKAMYCP